MRSRLVSVPRSRNNGDVARTGRDNEITLVSVRVLKQKA